MESCGQELVPREAGVAVWRVDRVHRVADIARVIQVITGAMSAAGHAEKEIYRAHLALEEAIVNAHKHGHRGDWENPIAVRYHVAEDGMVAEVEDQGSGFDPSNVADPLTLENLERRAGAACC